MATVPSTAVVIVPTGVPTDGFSTIDIGTVRQATITVGAPGPKITNAPGSLVAVGAGNCPNGFSTCGPQYNGGCCRFGRQCGPSYCPVSNGGTGTATITTNGLCPGGWYECPASVSGGCCPSGYGCGALVCPAAVTGAPAAQKLAPVGDAGGSVYGDRWNIGKITGLAFVSAFSILLLF